MPNIIASIIVADTTISKSLPLIILPKAIQANTVAAIQETMLGHLPVIGSFWLLRKIFSLGSYVTLLRLLTKYGTSINVAHIIAELTSLGTSSNSERVTDMEVPVVIPNQNIKFQKLSLFHEKVLTGVVLAGAFVASVCTFSIKYLKPNLLINYLNIITNNIVTNIVAFLARTNKHLIAFLMCLSVTCSFNLTYAAEIPQLISEAEKKYNIPHGLLSAIAQVESDGQPHALNISGKTIVANSKSEAVETISNYLKKGITNIDIGVMQINWHYHRNQFGNLEEMLDSSNNIEYAAKLLTSLYQKYGTWQKAVRYYHSAKDNYHRKYSRAVLISWMKN